MDAATADYPAIEKGLKDETSVEGQPVASSSQELVGPNGEQSPTEEELVTLRKVYGKVNYVSRAISTDCHVLPC